MASAQISPKRFSLLEKKESYIVSELDFNLSCAFMGTVHSHIGVNNILNSIHEPVVGLWEHFPLLRLELETEISLNRSIGVQIANDFLSMVKEILPLQSSQLRNSINCLLACGRKIHSQSLKLKLVDLLLDPCDEDFTLDGILLKH